MAGQKVEAIEGGVGITGLPVIVITENGDVEVGDEWAIFRLTDDGLSWYQMGYEFAVGIMTLEIDGKRAVEEVVRFKTKEEAVNARDELSEMEKERILIRSVRPR